MAYAFHQAIYFELTKRYFGDETLTCWTIDKIVHFGSEDIVKKGLPHFGFHDRNGKHYAILHQKHVPGLIGRKDRLEWTLAAHQILKGVPNITATLNYPMYIDNLNDKSLIVSSFGDAHLYRVNVEEKKAELFVDGSRIGMRDAGNCVVDDENNVWVNEVTDCKIWRFDSTGKPTLTLGDGTPGFQTGTVEFSKARFNWIYDIRRGPDGNIYVLDSKNFAVRMTDQRRHTVRTLAGTGKPGYEGDNGDALNATFGSDPTARFDGPISLSLDEEGNIFVGDRQNHIVRMIHTKTNMIETIAGNRVSVKGKSNNPEETDPLRLNLPEISSMDYHDGFLLVPTDITPEEGDLVVLTRKRR